MGSADATSPRAKLVEGLWQLKQQCEQQDDQGLRHMHFNTLMKDPDYRDEIIRRAAASRNPKIRTLAARLADLDNRDVLVNRQLSGSVGTIENPDITATRMYVGDDVPRPRARRLWLSALAVVLVLGAGLAALLLRDSGPIRVSGSLFGEQLWRADREYLLTDLVYVEAGARLVIEPGTRILGDNGSALVVTRDATLHARGTAEAPIVFTSARPAGQRAPGDWGGLVMLGNAPVNVSDARIEGVPEGDTRAAFGGADSSSNCGVLEFARIEFAGFEAYANNELNGLTLGGCGSNTIVRNVQVHHALDDGVEVFGGTVDLKRVVITGAGDDSLDWDMGWQGRVQYLVVQQHPGVGDNAFEGDNRKVRHDAQPVSSPVFYNVTLVSGQSGDKYQRAMTLRRGSGGQFHNLVVEGFSGEAIDIRDEATVARIAGGELRFDGMLLYNIGAGGQTYFEPEAADKDDDGGFDEAAYFTLGNGAEIASRSSLPSAATDVRAPYFVPGLRSDAARGAVAVPEGEFWDEAAAYRGAVRPGVSRSWLDGWTAFPES